MKTAPYIPEASLNGGILTFQAARLHFQNGMGDALLDMINPRGGCFILMTEGLISENWSWEKRDQFFALAGKIELEWGWGASSWRLPCRIRGYSLDEEGLTAYLTLRFIAVSPSMREHLLRLTQSLW